MKKYTTGTVFTFFVFLLFFGCTPNERKKEIILPFANAELLNPAYAKMPTRTLDGVNLLQGEKEALEKTLSFCSFAPVTKKDFHFRFLESLIFRIYESNGSCYYLGLTSTAWFLWNPEDHVAKIPLQYTNPVQAKSSYEQLRSLLMDNGHLKL